MNTEEDREATKALRKLERKQSGGTGPLSYSAPARDPGAMYWTQGAKQ